MLGGSGSRSHEGTARHHLRCFRLSGSLIGSGGSLGWQVSSVQVTSVGQLEYPHDTATYFLQNEQFKKPRFWLPCCYDLASALTITSECFIGPHKQLLLWEGSVVATYDTRAVAGCSYH